MRNSILTCLFLIALSSTAVAAAHREEPGEHRKTPEVLSHLEIEPIFQGRVHILESGRGNSPGILLVHGLGDEASATWKELIPQLAASYHVVAVDLPGFGRSEKQNKLYSPTAYADFLKWAVDRYLPGPVVLVGHSLGGAVAIKYVATYPQGVEKLILADVAGILHRRVYTREIAEPGVRENTSGLPDVLPRIDRIVGRFIAKLPELPIELDLVLENRFMRGRLLGGDPGKIAAMALIEENFSKDLRRIDVPCHILWGADDIVTPPRTGILLEAVIDKATLQIIPDSGHVPMRDRPGVFNRAVIDAIAGSSAPNPAEPATSIPVGRCTDRDGMIFRGRYERLEISDCRNVTLKDITCGNIDIRRSEVDFVRGTLQSDQTALTVIDSSVKATGTLFKARRAIVASRSRLDLAGVELIGETSAIETPDRSSVVFSVSRIKSPQTAGFIHGPADLTPDSPL